MSHTIGDEHQLVAAGIPDGCGEPSVDLADAELPLEIAPKEELRSSLIRLGFFDDKLPVQGEDDLRLLVADGRTALTDKAKCDVACVVANNREALLRAPQKRGGGSSRHLLRVLSAEDPDNARHRRNVGHEHGERNRSGAGRLLNAGLSRRSQVQVPSFPSLDETLA